MIERVFALHTSTHAPEKSTSAALTKAALDLITKANPQVQVRWVDGAALNVAPNLSCYADGKKNCADPASGPYRCWANVNAKGSDEMPVIYDNLAWCDTLLFSTSTRWGSHTAAAQTIIERMNTLENRAVAYGEPYPLKGKKLGVIASGLHWKTGAVAKNLHETLMWWGFASSPECILAWQRSRDPFFEHPDSDLPTEKRWLLSSSGTAAVGSFVRALTSARRTIV